VRIRRHDPAALRAAERDELYRFVTRFIAYPRDAFDAALASAEYLWLGRDRSGELVASTAVRTLATRVDRRPAKAIYTSMVAVDPAFRRAGLIPTMGWKSYLAERLRSPTTPLYWFATMASPAGYLAMARHFGERWPRRGVETPEAERALLEQLVAWAGFSRTERVNGCLRIVDDFGVSEARQDPDRWDRSDPDVRFFLSVNPDYRSGTLLPCLCRLGLVPVASALVRRLRHHAHVAMGGPHRPR
jgi:GNAT superfamily N-acetyltransferase